MIEDHNKLPIVEAMGPQLTEMGGAGTGFDNFDRHMGAVGVAIEKNASAPSMGGPESGNDLSGLVTGNNLKPQTLGRG